MVSSRFPALFLVFLALGTDLCAQQAVRSRDKKRLFRDGDIYMGTAQSCLGGPAIIRLDRETLTPTVFCTQSIGAFRYDSFRDCLIGSGTISGTPNGMRRVDAYGRVFPLPAATGGQPAPNGKGLIYFNFPGGIWIIDRDDQLVPLIDIATGNQADISGGSDEKMLYDSSANALFVLTRYGPVCAPSTTTASLRKLTLDATGMYVLSISGSVILGCPSDSSSLDSGPAGSVIAHTHGGGPGYSYRAYIVDAHTMVPTLYATWTGPMRVFTQGDYSKYLGSAIVATADIVGSGSPDVHYRDAIWSFAQGSVDGGAQIYIDIPSDSCVFGAPREMEVIKY